MTADRVIDLPLPGLPGLLDIHVRHLPNPDTVPYPDIEASLVVREDFLNPAGTVHAGSVVALADTACGYGCLASLPDGKTGFTTLELKSNHVGTAVEGDTLVVHATAAHRGGNTQVWDAIITAHSPSSQTPRTIAIFRCTQYLLGHTGSADRNT